MKDNKASLIELYPEIATAPVNFEIPVLWGDMDSAKHVNNLVYLGWAETARIQLFEKLMNTSFDGKEGPILGWQDCKYIFPMTYPDNALITTRVTEVKKDRFNMVSRIYSIRHKKLAAISYQSIIPYDYQAFRKIDLPSKWVRQLTQLT